MVPNKVVLIIPPSPWLISDMDMPMLGPLYIASYLKVNGIDVQIADLSSLPKEHWRIPVGNIYGITGVTPQYPYMRQIVDILTQREPDCMIVCGGVHATVLPEHILSNSQVDVCVIGEGEETMLELAQNQSLNLISGIVFRESDKIIYNPPRNFIQNLDSLPFPDRESIDAFQYLKARTFKYLADGKREGSIFTSRGCPYNCKFCASPRIWKRKVRYRSVSNVIAELNFLVDKYGIGLCNFLDDTFVLNKPRIYEICEGIPEGLKWFCLNRCDLVDRDLFKTMHKAGCVSMTVGFESGSNKILEIIGKKTTVEQAYEFIEIATECGIKVRGQIMVGLPGETWDDVKLTADFIQKAKKVTNFGIHIFQPFPGCEYETFRRDFEHFHTIGKPGTRLTNDPTINEQFEFLRKVAADRDIIHFGALEEN